MVFISEWHFPGISILLSRSWWNGGWGSRQLNDTACRWAVLWPSALSSSTAVLRVVSPQDAIPQNSCARPMTHHYNEHEAIYVLDIKLPQCSSAAKTCKYSVIAVALWTHNTRLELTTLDFLVTCFTTSAIAMSFTYLV